MSWDCLIIGGSGFIGRHLVELLVAKSEYRKIVILDLVKPDFGFDNIEYINCDIRRPIDIDISSYNVKTLYFLAALAKEPGYEWNEYFETNYGGAQNVVDFMVHNNIKQLIYTSTMMVFKAGECEVYESTLPNPDTAYGISKLLAEKELEAWSNKWQTELKIIRLGVVFGKYENGNYTRLYRALKRNLFAYVGRKDTIKGSVYVKDVVEFLFYAVDKGYNQRLIHLVLPGDATIERIVNTLLSCFGIKRWVPILPVWPLLIVALFFQILNALGLRNPIHYRRIQKLNNSTNMKSERIDTTGYVWKFDLKTALLDWKRECGNGDLY